MPTFTIEISAVVPHEGIQSGMARLWRVPAEVREVAGQIHHELGVTEEEDDHLAVVLAEACRPCELLGVHVLLARDLLAQLAEVGDGEEVPATLLWMVRTIALNLLIVPISLELPKLRRSDR
ncbi:hypothetical protein OOK58_58990 [Streptomyces sp. NBC_01728]|uniref:hypothetical protein n=1 Tax=unclassified Streptomyces TaxID=2593676 RepID=UPI00225099D6|nr:MULTISPECIES: hypothetical protein [unclassified Streptomyces]MCX4462396.1 hypothetical protein [Streptomyces sp. NBC_01719]MCX4500826.1 hypothetical protein [Streptomyces sp. NBC_01728]